MHINDDIILNGNIDDAITEHKEWVDLLGDKDIFYVTELKTDAVIDDENAYFSSKEIMLSAFLMKHIEVR